MFKQLALSVLLPTVAYAAEPLQMSIGDIEDPLVDVIYITHGPSAQAPLDPHQVYIMASSKPNFCEEFNSKVLHTGGVLAYAYLAAADDVGPGTYALAPPDSNSPATAAGFFRPNPTCGNALTAEGQGANNGTIQVISIDADQLVGSITATSFDGVNHIDGNFVATFCPVDWEALGKRDIQCVD